ncbi:MAG: hypothetical protein QMC74_20330 [Myxococcota bacterium]|jgi:ubiquinone biosynthesis protein UbiJ
MATKTTNKTTKKKAQARNTSIEFNWEDITPEWATEGIERINSEFEKLTDELQSRADELQNRGEKFRKESRKRIEKNVKQAQKELRKVPAIKRAEEFRSEFEKNVEKNIDAGVDRVYSGLKLARIDEVKKLEKKIAQLNKKLRTLEKAQAA